MSRLLAASLVLLLAWSMLPGGMELAENASHLVVHGDLAHDQAKTGHGPFNPEHGCGGGFHLCSCCHTQPSDSSSYPVVGAPTALSGASPIARRSSAGPGFLPLPEEPPRA